MENGSRARATTHYSSGIVFVSLISAQNPPPAATRYKLGRIIVALSDNANLRRDADREVYGRESRVQIAEAPQAERAIKMRGSREGGRLLKGIRIVGRSDRKSLLSRCEIARISRGIGERLDNLSIKGT